MINPLLVTVQYWDKAEDNANLITPDIGDFAGTIVGSISHEAAKFNNGANVDNVTSGLYYGRSNIAPNSSRYVIELQLKWKVSSATWSVVQFFCGDRQFLTYHGISFRLNANKTWRVQIKDGAGDNNYDSAAITFAQDQEDHVVLIIDSAASFDGAKTFSVRRNGVEELSGTRSINFVTLDPSYGFFASIIGGGASFIVGATDVIFDNPKIYLSTAIPLLDLIEANKENEGFPDFTAPIIDSRLPTYNRKVIIADIDLYQLGYVMNFPDVEYNRSFDVDRLFINELKINCRNEDGFHSVDNPKSPFSSVDLTKASTVLYDRDNNLIFDGNLVSKPLRNERTFISEYRARNKYYADRYKRIEYASGGSETAVDVVENILTDLGLEDIIDHTSFDRSKSLLDTNGVSIQVNLILDDDTNLITIFEMLAHYSSADIYDFKGKIHFQVWEPLADRIVSKLIDLDGVGILKKPVIDPFIGEKHLINDYEIEWSGGTVTDSTSDDLGALSRTRNGVKTNKFVQSKTPIEFQSAAAADWVGQQHMKRTHKNFLTKPEHLQRTTFEIESEKFDFFDFTSIFGVNYSPEAWSNKAHEMFKLNYKDKDNSVGIEAYEIAS